MFRLVIVEWFFFNSFLMWSANFNGQKGNIYVCLFMTSRCYNMNEISCLVHDHTLSPFVLDARQIWWTCRLEVAYLRLSLWVLIPFRRGVLDTTLCYKVCQWLAADRWFYRGTPISFANKRHFQQYFSYIVEVSFIGGGIRSTRGKSLTSCK